MMTAASIAMQHIEEARRSLLEAERALDTPEVEGICREIRGLQSGILSVELALIAQNRLAVI